MQTAFHFAYHVDDIQKARSFYGDLLGCEEGRSAETWVDYNFFGHQISLHLGETFSVSNTGIVGDHKVPMPHFGVVLPMAEWRKLSDHLRASGMTFILKPHIRFEGEPGEQATMFFTDPAGNPIEVKGMVDFDNLFASQFNFLARLK